MFIIENEDFYNQGYEDARKKFERPKGQWIKANGTYYCSHCKHYAYESQRFDFCQDCGADMRFRKDCG